MKSKTEAQLKKKLWPLVSAYIRKRDRGVCMACGALAEGGAYHAGHLVPRPLCGPVLYFHPLNLWGSCYRCNIHLGGNGALLAHRLSKKYHFNFVGYFEELRRKTKNVQWDKKKVQALIVSFENEDYAVAFYRIMGLKNPLT